MTEEVAFVTDDKWMRDQGGQLDPTDVELLAEASCNGRFAVKVMNIREMFIAMEQEDPRKFKEFEANMERQEGKPLSFDDIVDLAKKGQERMEEFTRLVATMTLGQAAQIHHWRVEAHMTWRSVARAAYTEGWFSQKWDPPSNQIMGMALAERAAQLFSENFREAPWN